MRGDIVDDAAAGGGNIGRELDDPVQVLNLLEELHHHVERNVLEKGLVLGAHLSELGEELVWDVNGPWARIFFLES